MKFTESFDIITVSNWTFGERIITGLRVCFPTYGNSTWIIPLKDDKWKIFIDKRVNKADKAEILAFVEGIKFLWETFDYKV